MRKFLKGIQKYWIICLCALFMFVCMLPVKTYALDYSGTAYAILTGDGELIFFRSTESYTAGTGVTATDLNGTSYTGQLYTGIETLSGSGTANSPWYAQCDNILSVSIASGQGIRPINCSYWFFGCENMTSCNMTGLDASNVQSMYSMFAFCRRMNSVQMTDINAAILTDVSCMFQNCEALEDIDLSMWSVSGLTNMKRMFDNCVSLESVDMSGWDTSSVTDMSFIFNNCTSLTVPGIDALSTASVTDMHGMFLHCSALESVNLSGWNVRNVTCMASMFDGCTSLTNAGVGSFAVLNVTDMSDMFRNCTSLSGVSTGTWDMQSVKYLSEMFKGCTALTSISFESAGAANIYSTASMFNGCTALGTIDISGLSTTTSGLKMGDMFTGCTALNEITLGPAFSFIGNNITTAADKSILPTPPTTVTSGKWINTGDDGTIGAKTPAQLQSSYGTNAATWEGTWVWDIATNKAAINLDARGGYVEQNQILLTTIAPVELPEATRPWYRFQGWTESLDGTGTMYEAGDEFTPEGGQVYTLHANWIQLKKYKVNYYQQDVTLDGYTLVETALYGALTGETVEAPLKEYTGFKTPAGQTLTIPDDDSGEVSYYYDRNKYKIRYNGNGADSGTMPEQSMIGHIQAKIYDNKFKKTGHVFNGWNSQADGQGRSFGDAQVVNDLAGDNEIFDMYAQWIDISENTKEPTEGKYTITLQAGQTATIPDLPAGTHYTISEVSMPNGWSQQSATGDEGSIQGASKSTSNISNTYTASGSASITAYVTMNPGELSQGQFTFQLLQGTTVLQTVTNGLIDEAEEILGPDGETTIANPYYGMSIISFEPIAFNTTGSTTYTIKQVIPANPDETIHYDDHVETFTVSRLDNNDGTLVCTPSYDASGPVFENGNIPVFEDPAKTGDLFVRNIVTNIENDQTDFTYTVSLKDNNGTDLTDNYKYMIVSQDNMDNHFSELITTRHESANSRTENIDALGNQLSNYGNNWTNNNIRGTGRTSAVNQAHVISFPGAEQMDVTIVYGGQSATYDYVCMWNGSYPTYVATSYSSSLTGRLGGGSHTAAANTKTYKVNGDSVTFAYRSNGSNYGDGYGYYAVVTADITGMNPDYAIDTGTLTSGSTVTIKPGQALMIHALPEGTAYDITQADMPGYELVNMTDVKGSILQASPSIAVFENVYTATGSVSIQMNKAVTNGHTPYDAYEFELRDSTNNIIQRVQNDANGNIRFAPIDYTQDDINQSYTYAVTEVIGDNPDIIYDGHIENVSVYVADAGGGSLTVTPTYAGAGLFTNTVTLKYDVSIRKTNPAGTSVTGAGLRLTGRADGAEEDIEPLTWETDGNAYVANLKPGTYTLSETQTPSDYQTAADITFVLQNNGTIMTGNQQVNDINMVDNFNSRELTITNTVSGNLGNKATVFNYTLEFEDSGTAPDTLHYSKGGTDGTLTKDGSGKFTFSVDHGEELIITDMPYGAVFTVTQTSGPEYTTSWQFTDTSASTPQDVSSGSGKSAGETMSNDMTLAFGNNLQSAIPTGVSTGLSVMVFVVLAIIVAAFIFDSKRRKKVNKK